MKKIVLILVAAFVTTLNSCSTDEPSLKEKITGNGAWHMTVDCLFSGLLFNNDNSGQIWYDAGCINGQDCTYLLTFDWELEGTTLKVTYNTDATNLCSNIISADEAYLLPDPETVFLEGNPIQITLYGATFELN